MSDDMKTVMADAERMLNEYRFPRDVGDTMVALLTEVERLRDALYDAGRCPECDPVSALPCDAHDAG